MQQNLMAAERTGQRTQRGTKEELRLLLRFRAHLSCRVKGAHRASGATLDAVGQVRDGGTIEEVEAPELLLVCRALLRRNR